MDNPNYISQEDQVLSDYALLDFALSLGGRVVSVQSGKEEPPARVPYQGGAGVPLSKAHITPYVEYRAGASLLKAHRGGEKPEQVGGGLRGAIVGFSDNARRRLLYMVAGVRRDAVLPLFVTLTYPNIFPDPKTSKRHLDIFIKRIRRVFPGVGLIWKLEPQQRGAPHYHLLVWGCDLAQLMQFVPQAWYEIAGGGDHKHLLWHGGMLGNGNVHCVQQVNSFKGVMAYASKYLGKTFEVAGWEQVWTGRFWGVVNQPNIPLGELVEEEVTKNKALEFIRYQRRFTGFKNFRSNKSLTTFCDADQWIEKVLNKKRTA